MERSSSRDIYERGENIGDTIQRPPTPRMNGKASSQLQHPEAAELEKKFSQHETSEEKSETCKVGMVLFHSNEIDPHREYVWRSCWLNISSWLYL